MANTPTGTKRTKKETLVHPNPDPTEADNPRLRQRHPLRALAKAVGIAVRKTCASPTPPAPITLAAALKMPDAKAWAAAYDAKLGRHSKEPKTWYYGDQRPDDKLQNPITTFRAKTNMYGGLQRHKARIAMRGDRMRPGLDFDPTRTASHMPRQAGRRLLVASAAVQGHEIQSWDVSGAYMRAPNDPRYRVTMRQPPRSDGSYEAQGIICVIYRALPGAPDANALWDSFRDMWLQN